MFRDQCLEDLYALERIEARRCWSDQLLQFLRPLLWHADGSTLGSWEHERQPPVFMLRPYPFGIRMGAGSRWVYSEQPSHRRLRAQRFALCREAGADAHGRVKSARKGKGKTGGGASFTKDGDWGCAVGCQRAETLPSKAQEGKHRRPHRPRYGRDGNSFLLGQGEPSPIDRRRRLNHQ